MLWYLQRIYDALCSPCPLCGGRMVVEKEDDQNALVCEACDEPLFVWTDGFFDPPNSRLH